MKNNIELKASSKMRKSVEKMERKFGKLQKNYGVEPIESNRVGRGFYDYCQLTSDILKSFNVTVAHDGTIQ